MNSLAIFYRMLRKFYRELKRIEKILLYAYIIDMLTYVLLFVGTLISTGNTEVYMYIPVIFFPIMSGLIMFYGKTVYHGLAFLGVHSFPIFGAVGYYYTQYFNCRDNIPDACNSSIPSLKYYNIGVISVVVFVVLFHLLHTLCVYLLWKRRIWPLVYEFEYSKHDEIKEMHAVYEIQFPLFHATIMMVGLWLIGYSFVICGIDLVRLAKRQATIEAIFTNFQIPFNVILLYYLFFMIKGVRDEKNYLIYIVYFGNLIQGLLLFFDLRSYCKRLNLTTTYVKTTMQCFNYALAYNTLFLYAFLCWTVLALSTWNTIRCHKNFNMHMAFYIKYEPTPPEFKSDKKLEKRKSIEPKSHIV